MTRDIIIHELTEALDTLADIQSLIAGGGVATEKPHDEVAEELSIAVGTLQNVLSDGFGEFV